MTDANTEYLKALEYVLERAEILLLAPSDHAKLVAEGKLKDAVNIAYMRKKTADSLDRAEKKGGS